MNELYEAIEAKIKASGYPREISGEATMTSVTRSKEKKTEITFSSLNSRRMWYLNITLPFQMTNST